MQRLPTKLASDSAPIVPAQFCFDPIILCFARKWAAAPAIKVCYIAALITSLCAIVAQGAVMLLVFPSMTNQALNIPNVSITNPINVPWTAATVQDPNNFYSINFRTFCLDFVVSILFRLIFAFLHFCGSGVVVLETPSTWTLCHPLICQWRKLFYCYNTH